MFMYLTIILALLALLSLAVIFGIAYAVKGLKTALIITGIFFVVMTALYIAVISAIVGLMPN
jgi:hypothetical protein